MVRDCQYDGKFVALEFQLHAEFVADIISRLGLDLLVYGLIEFLDGFSACRATFNIGWLSCSKTPWHCVCTRATMLVL